MGRAGGQRRIAAISYHRLAAAGMQAVTLAGSPLEPTITRGIMAPVLNKL